MTKSKSILLTLRPADYYFFGGENTFDSAPERRNYLVRSNKLPQQTGLLGVIRHALYLAGMDIGDASFSPVVAAPKFGLIDELSPLFMQWNSEGQRRFFYPGTQLHLNEEQEIKVDFEQGIGQGLLGNSWTDLPHLSFINDKGVEETYSEKQYLNEVWVSLDAEAIKIPANVDAEKLPDLHKKPDPRNGIFFSSMHIGIDKASRMNDAKNPLADQDGFYKQEFYRLAPGFSFAVKVDFLEEVDLDIFNRTMPFGGENRTFMLHAEPWTNELGRQFQLQKAFAYTDERVVLLSDAYVPDLGQIMELCRFAVTQSKPFRNLQLATASYQGKTPLEQRKVFSDLGKARYNTLHHLLERGSVFFPKKDKQSALMEKLEAAANFHKIGYNHIYPSTPKN